MRDDHAPVDAVHRSRARSPQIGRRTLLGAGLAAPFMTPALSGCGAAEASPHRLRLGHFSNLTHGVALAGMARGTFARHLGSTAIERQVFDNGPAAVQAMLAGAIDVAYLGPNPAITAWVRTKGAGVRLLAGAAENGAALVARPGVKKIDDLRGCSVSTPQIGGTQDVALKTLLAEHHLTTGPGADEVETVWMANSQTLDQFRQGRLDASYQAEPWVSRLVVEAGAHVLVDERTQWPDHRFVTTCLLVTQEYLERAPAQVEQLLAAHVETVEWINSHRGAASVLLNAEIGKLSGKKLKRSVAERAMDNVQFSWDPLMANIAQVAEHTWRTDGIDVRPDLRGLADLDPLRQVLAARALPAITDAGLGVHREG
ncbi:ABC transporter substrate-binding protein [Dermacoccus nishinomiyaensis]|uniref:ABC transporter substrate-binding protein n=1 Tax=Dermacoccus nishinomiyaensis TaxID=1274 RepID=UPI0030B8D273